MPGSILVADDEKAMLNLYARIFTGTGYDVTMASSFSEAASLLKSKEYDLLVTDLMFPDGVGTELVKLFEKKKEGAKSLVVTGSAPAQDRRKLSPASVYFEKPFKVDIFLAAVAMALGA